MKRKYADRPHWSRIMEKTYKSIFIHEDLYYGHVAFYRL